MADLEGAFDSVWREGAIYNLYKAGTTNNLLLVLASFLKHHQYKNFSQTTYIWSITRVDTQPTNFSHVHCSADMSADEENTTEHE